LVNGFGGTKAREERGEKEGSAGRTPIDGLKISCFMKLLRGKKFGSAFFGET